MHAGTCAVVAPLERLAAALTPAAMAAVMEVVCPDARLTAVEPSPDLPASSGRDQRHPAVIRHSMERRRRRRRGEERRRGGFSDSILRS